MRPRRRDAVDAALYTVPLRDGVAVDESPGDAIEQARLIERGRSN